MTLTTRRELVFETATDRVFDALTTLDGLAGVVWTCPTNTGHPDWEGTTIAFDLRPTDCDAGVLSFRHFGLIPAYAVTRDARAAGSTSSRACSTTTNAEKAVRSDDAALQRCGCVPRGTALCKTRLTKRPYQANFPLES